MGRLVGLAVGRRLVHIEAQDARDAVHGSVEALQGLTEWTEDPSQLRAVPYTELGSTEARGTWAMAARKCEKRSDRMEWEHIGPAPWIGENHPCWSDGHALYGKSDGTPEAWPQLRVTRTRLNWSSRGPICAV